MVVVDLEPLAKGHDNLRQRTQALRHQQLQRRVSRHQGVFQFPVLRFQVSPGTSSGRVYESDLVNWIPPRFYSFKDPTAWHQRSYRPVSFRRSPYLSASPISSPLLSSPHLPISTHFTLRLAGPLRPQPSSFSSCPYTCSTQPSLLFGILPEARTNMVGRHQTILLFSRLGAELFRVGR